MKKIVLFSLILSLVCATLLTGCSNETGGTTEQPAATAGDVIKIGVYEPISGDNGPGGKQEVLGVQYANSLVNTVNVGGKEYKVELVIVDNESSTDKGPAAANELVSSGVSLVLGSYGSGVSIAASEIFKDAGIPAIGITCTNPQVTEGNDHYFRICFLDPFQGTVLANFAKDNWNAKTAYCLAKLGDDYSVGLCHYFKVAFEALGGTVITETYPEGNSDFKSYLTNATNAGADIFFSPVSTEAAALIIEQANSQGFKLPILAGDTWDSNVITSAAKGTDVSVYVTTFYQEGGESEAAKTFDTGVKKWITADPTNLANNNGNDEISAVTAMGYDSYMFALEAIKKADSTEPGKIMEAIWNTSYEGVTGLIEIQEPGDAKRDAAYIKTANTQTGSWDFVAVQGAK